VSVWWTDILVIAVILIALGSVALLVVIALAATAGLSELLARWLRK
jgi:hypothetical protein